MRKTLLPIFASLLPVLAHAQQVQDPIFQSFDQVIRFACFGMNIIFTGAIIVTIIFVLLAAMQYITHGGDPGKVADAHKRLLWAAAGFAVALAARSVPFFVGTVLGRTPTDPCS